MAISGPILRSSLAAVVLLVMAAPASSAGEPSVRTPSPEQTVSLSIEDESIESAMGRLAETLSLDIEVQGEGLDAKRTLEIRDHSLQESINRLLQPLSHVLIWRTDGGLTVLVLNEPDGQIDSAKKTPLASLPSEPLGTPESLFPWGDEILPAENPDESGLTAEDLEFHRTTRLLPMVEDEEVLPPSGPETPGLMKADAGLAPLDSLAPIVDQEILPPDNPGGQGIQMGELVGPNTIGGVSAGQDEILPPDESGGAGMTVAEFTRLEAERLQQPPQPTSDLDLFPPE